MEPYVPLPDRGSALAAPGRPPVSREGPGTGGGGQPWQDPGPRPPFARPEGLLARLAAFFARLLRRVFGRGRPT
jgi:hypothetical protein